MRFVIVAVIVWGLAADGRADPPITLRIASVAPEGTAWAHEFTALAREVAQQTGGALRVKWYLGGIAGTDVEAAERVSRGQLDGVGAGAWQCEKWAPSIRVTRMPGLFRSRAELKYVGGSLRPVFDEEFRKAGFVNLGLTVIGRSVVFLRDPVHTFSELRRVKLWSLADDDTKRKLFTTLGLTIVPLSFEASRRAFDEHMVDGFMAPPTAALAFRWSTQARWLLDLPTDDILGCVVLSAKAYERLPPAHRQALLVAVAKSLLRFDDVGARADGDLLGGLFERQGLKVLHVDEQFRAEFAEAAQAVWQSVGTQLVPAQLLTEVTAMLTEYRAQAR